MVQATVLRWPTALAHRLVLASLCLALLSLVGILFASPSRASSEASATPLEGYAWSDTIGWISLSGSGYGISIAGDGSMSGYAWSDSIGWISANSGDLTGCPAAPCTARESSGAFAGWLKAVAAGGGWDGFISLAGPGYGVVESDGVISGYAWGSEVVGWVDFQYASSFAPICTFSASPTSTVQGHTAMLSWTSERATSGTMDPGDVSMTPVAGGSVGVQPTTTTRYTGTFTGAGGTTQCETTVAIQCAPLYACAGAAITYTNAACATSTVDTCMAPTYCVAGQSACQFADIELVGDLTAQPSIVRVGDRTRLYWDVSGAESCAVSGGGQNWTGLSSGVGGVQTNPLVQLTRYTLACEAYEGHDDLEATFDVLVTPIFNEH